MKREDCITWDEAVELGLYSRSWWKADGVIIAEDAKPKAYGWKAKPKKFSYGLYREDQGVRRREHRIPADDLAAMDTVFTPADMF